jgi:hypothetical protein
MIDTLDDVEPPYREGDSLKTERAVKWPSVEEAKRRLEILIEGQSAEMAARDLIVIMREIGRLMNENADLRAFIEKKL